MPQTTLEIRQSPGKMILILLGGVALMACSIFCFWIGWTEAGGPNWFLVLFGGAAFAFFSLCFAVGVHRLISVKDPVVTLSPRGLRDFRIAPETVPWDAITQIGEFSVHGQHMVVLDLNPAAEARLSLSRAARMGRRASVAMGLNGLAISMTGLSMGHRDFVAALERYRETHA